MAIFGPVKFSGADGGISLGMIGICVLPFGFFAEPLRLPDKAPMEQKPG